MNNNLTCSFCNKSFSTISNLDRHKKTTKTCFLKTPDSFENIKKYDCEFCPKTFTSKQSLNYHMKNACKIIKSQTRLEEEVKILKEEVKQLKEKPSKEHTVKVDKDHYIYCLIEREFLKSGESIYKVGRSTGIVKRFRNYPKGSKIVFLASVDDCVLAEQDLLKYLNSNEKFLKMKEIGSEYYKANAKDLLEVLTNIALSHNKIYEKF